MSSLNVDVPQSTSAGSLDSFCATSRIDECDFLKPLDKNRGLCIERNRSFDERSLSELSTSLSPHFSARRIEHSRLVDHLENVFSPGRISGLNTPRSQTNFEPHPMVVEAWDALHRTLVFFRGQPVGTIAALDNVEEALNYDQVIFYYNLLLVLTERFFLLQLTIGKQNILVGE